MVEQRSSKPFVWVRFLLPLNISTLKLATSTKNNKLLKRKKSFFNARQSTVNLRHPLRKSIKTSFYTVPHFFWQRAVWPQLSMRLPPQKKQKTLAFRAKSNFPNPHNISMPRSPYRRALTGAGVKTFFLFRSPNRSLRKLSFLPQSYHTCILPQLSPNRLTQFHPKILNLFSTLLNDAFTANMGVRQLVNVKQAPLPQPVASNLLMITGLGHSASSSDVGVSLGLSRNETSTHLFLSYSVSKLMKLIAGPLHFGPNDWSLIGRKMLVYQSQLTFNQQLRLRSQQGRRLRWFYATSTYRRWNKVYGRSLLYSRPFSYYTYQVPQTFLKGKFTRQYLPDLPLTLRGSFWFNNVAVNKDIVSDLPYHKPRRLQLSSYRYFVRGTLLQKHLSVGRRKSSAPVVSPTRYLNTYRLVQNRTHQYALRPRSVFLKKNLKTNRPREFRKWRIRKQWRIIFRSKLRLKRQLLKKLKRSLRYRDKIRGRIAYKRRKLLKPGFRRRVKNLLKSQTRKLLPNVRRQARSYLMNRVKRKYLRTRSPIGRKGPLLNRSAANLKAIRHFTSLAKAKLRTALIMLSSLNYGGHPWGFTALCLNKSKLIPKGCNPSLNSAQRLPVLDLATFVKVWSSPVLLRYLLLAPRALNSTTRGSLNLVNHLRPLSEKIQLQCSVYLLNSTFNTLPASNIWLVPSLNYRIRKYLLRVVTKNTFAPKVAIWYHQALINFMETCTGRRIALHFGPFIDNALTFEDRAFNSILAYRVKGFTRILGHRIFVNEGVDVVATSLRLKDPTFLANWIKGMLKRMNFWKFRLLFRYIKFLLKHMFIARFPQYQFKGFKLQLKGKISVAGNARTRTLRITSGDTSYTTMDNRIAYDLSYFTTFTGVLGLKIWFFY